MIMDGSKVAEPKEGMGATLLMWSDRHAYTIHKVEGKKLWASRDNTKLIAGNHHSESQEYEFSNENQNDESKWQLFSFRKDGRWHNGTSLKGTTLLIGTKKEYYDPTF